MKDAFKVCAYTREDTTNDVPILIMYTCLHSFVTTLVIICSISELPDDHESLDGMMMHCTIPTSDYNS